jgi:hypothetical protein
MAYDISLGNNDLSSNSLFFQRERYDNLVFPDQGEKATAPQARNINLYYKKPLYGRIDDLGTAIIADKEIQFSDGENVFTNQNSLLYMKKIPSSRNLYAMNFVVDAFNDMVNYVNTSCTVRGTNANSNITPLKAIKAHLDPVSLYKAYFSSLYTEFIFTENLELSPKIKNFKDFYNHFNRFLVKISKIRPITFSNFVATRFCSPLISGLVLEIAESSYSNDEDKINEILNDINFDFFAKGAARFGFKIDKHVPFRIIADIDSEVMIEYMKKYNIQNRNQLFSSQFIPAYILDARLLRQQIFLTYKLFISNNLEYEEYSQSKDCNFSKRYFVGERQDIDITEYGIAVGLKEYIALIAELKYYENKIQEKNKDILKNIINNSLNIYSSIEELEKNKFIIRENRAIANIDQKNEALRNALSYIYETTLNHYNFRELNKALPVR